MSIEIPTVETERLILRAPCMDDLEAMCTFYAEPRSHFVGGPTDRGQVWRTLLRSAGHWQIRGYGIWHVTDRESGEMAGFTGPLNHIEWPEPELAYSIFSRFEGRGYAYEAASAARAAAAKHFGLTRLISLVDPENDRSRALALRLGATFERAEKVLGHVAHIYRHPEIAG
ncbi:GNAT family N-acetyltransferase [Alloyangia pacifica]|uniref:Protein N-acetyltransferase, RimJ/RimL family n=1 Tax=Alloyangia pacifica TaxID=311180 RepID=A0A1I6V8E1_9RHOB|nr:GNAT family N-acetyltransferase [Alloyangia pacifica]SDH89793.1 Protein N-acetyltransferase, RimJ/RimL family [Alloyangia pacifica]SFT09961.1 Protein N-acetyltransferase, RimJ/RimL family [Alloyangia pacifica]